MLAAGFDFHRVRSLKADNLRECLLVQTGITLTSAPMLIKKRKPVYLSEIVEVQFGKATQSRRGSLTNTLSCVQVCVSVVIKTTMIAANVGGRLYRTRLRTGGGTETVGVRTLAKSFGRTTDPFLKSRRQSDCIALDYRPKIGEEK